MDLKVINVKKTSRLKQCVRAIGLVVIIHLKLSVRCNITFHLNLESPVNDSTTTVTN